MGIGGSLIIGICQGLTAEIGFAIFAYKRWDLLSTTIAGTLAGLGCFLYNWTVNPAWAGLLLSSAASLPLFPALWWLEPDVSAAAGHR